MATFVFLGSQKVQKFVKGAENAERRECREATECHLVFFKIQYSSFRFSFFQKLLDIWPVLSRQHYPGSPSFQFHPMQQLWDGQFLLDSTKATASREHIFFPYRNSLPRHNSRFFLNFCGLILSHRKFIYLTP
jgi:hypothetical protein